ncbi:MAG: efflux RND transporter periplasmic adaptor subunit [Thermoguttaceae bacterium]|nr:efflux RND transporter periplasmic adaptor subunit [Thermoguttaceae bacterium]
MKKYIIGIGSLCVIAALVYYFVPAVHGNVNSWFQSITSKTDDHDDHDGHDHGKHDGHENCNHDHGKHDDHDDHKNCNHDHGKQDKHDDHDDHKNCNHDHGKQDKHDDHDDHKNCNHDHAKQDKHDNHDGHDHAKHDDHDGHDHEQVMALELSDQALANIGIEKDSDFGEIKVGSYDKTLTFPAILEERPGETLTKIPSPVSGVVEKIYLRPGQMIQNGQALFDIRLTREDVITAQSDLLALIQKRDIILKEEQRLSGLEDGLAPQAKRDVAFQKMENDAAIKAKTSVLLLNGLPVDEVENKLIKNREIISLVTVYAPEENEDCVNGNKEAEGHCAHHQHLDNVYVQKGQSINLGDPLCQTSDMDQLLIRGNAYAYNERDLAAALESGANVTALFTQSGREIEKVSDLKIRNINNRVNSDDRTLNFYVELNNELEQHNEKETSGNPFLSWQFKPGLRCQLSVPYQKIENCIIVPVWALARQQADCYVFELSEVEKGHKTFIRRPVRVLHQTQTDVVLANDGSIAPGVKIALRGASQLQIALDAGGGKLQSACPCGDH